MSGLDRIALTTKIVFWCQRQTNIVGIHTLIHDDVDRLSHSWRNRVITLQEDRRFSRADYGSIPFNFQAKLSSTAPRSMQVFRNLANEYWRA